MSIILIKKKIGKRIQYYRKKKGLTQEQLAEMVNISTNHLSAIERGIYGVKLETLVEIINIIDCTADDIFTDVLKIEYKVKASRLTDELKKLDSEKQNMIFDIIEIIKKR